MIFALLIAGIFVLYLVVEERERRRTNHGAPTWLRRVARSARRHSIFLLTAVAAWLIPLARGKGFEDATAQALVALAVYAFMTLHAATLSLPRHNDDA